MDTEPIARLPDQLRKITDATVRAQTATHLLQVLADAQREITQQRRADVVQMRGTLKLREVAELLGMGIARVDQIAKGK